MDETRCFERVKPASAPKVDMTDYKPFDWDEFMRIHMPSIMAERARQNVPVVFEEGFRTIDAINQPEAVEAAKRWTESWNPGDRRGLMFMGTAGIGKSALAWSVVIALRERGFEVEANSFAGLLCSIRSTYNAQRDQPTEAMLIADMVQSDAVMLDDIGAEAPTEHALGILANLLDELYNHGVPLIVTTNLDGASLRKHWGGSGGAERVLSRMSEMVTPIKMQGCDLRKLKKTA